jgi:nicotinamide mononucleotide transporter
MSALYWITSAAALLGVWLNIRRHVACFAIWSVTNSVWVWADLEHGLYAQAALMAVYFVLSLYGLWKWSARKEEKPNGKKDPA